MKALPVLDAGFLSANLRQVNTEAQDRAGRLKRILFQFQPWESK
jgi:hypothetical protein